MNIIAFGRKETSDILKCNNSICGQLLGTQKILITNSKGRLFAVSALKEKDKPN